MKSDLRDRNNVTDDDGNSWFVPEDVFTANYRPTPKAV